MRKLSITPAAWTGLTDTDPRDSRLNTGNALALILGSYLCFFAAGVTNALYAVGTALSPVDYSTPRQVGVLTLRVGEIAGALVIFLLVRQWLNIPAALAGTPRRRTSPLPSLVTVAMFGGGYILGGLVLNALRASDANATGGGVVPNAMAWVGGPVTGINAGIVEEIIIVAIPVLLGRRAGWPPLVIVALSCFLRWPFHIYHDTWATIPWPALWGGANALAYLYLRRLAPLIILHATIDTTIDYGSAFGAGAALIPIGGAALAFAVLLWRVLAARTRQLPRRAHGANRSRSAGVPAQSEPSALPACRRRVDPVRAGLHRLHPSDVRVDRHRRRRRSANRRHRAWLRRRPHRVPRQQSPPAPRSKPGNRRCGHLAHHRRRPQLPRRTGRPHRPSSGRRRHRTRRRQPGELPPHPDRPRPARPAGPPHPTVGTTDARHPHPDPGGTTDNRRPTPLYPRNPQMIDFKDSSYMKLHEIPADEAYSLVSMMLIDGETLFAAFKTTRDHVVFTNKRVIAINIQGMTGNPTG